LHHTKIVVSYCCKESEAEKSHSLEELLPGGTALIAGKEKKEEKSEPKGNNLRREYHLFPRVAVYDEI
jgi:hypothetical protein